MRFPDIPDNETLRLARELSDQSSALNATRQWILNQGRRGSAFDPMAVRAFEELRRNQALYAHRNMLDLFSGAGSALRPVIGQLFRSNAEQAAMDAMRGLNSTALSQAVRDASAAFAFQQQHLFRDATMDAVRRLWRFDNPAFQALRADAFAGTLMSFVRDYTQVSDDAIEELQEIVDEKVKNLPRGTISADGILNLILTVVLFLAGIAYQEIRNNHASPSAALTETQVERIIQSIEKSRTLIPENDDHTYYVVERVVTIRVRPDNHSAVVAILYPNQKVRLEKRKHEWIYVEYFDYIEGIPKMGWVTKKYLKMLD
jgi:histone H3/H4